MSYGKKQIDYFVERNKGKFRPFLVEASKIEAYKPYKKTFEECDLINDAFVGTTLGGKHPYYIIKPLVILLNSITWDTIGLDCYNPSFLLKLDQHFQKKGIFILSKLMYAYDKHMSSFRESYIICKELTVSVGKSKKTYRYDGSKYGKKLTKKKNQEFMRFANNGNFVDPLLCAISGKNLEEPVTGTDYATGKKVGYIAIEWHHPKFNQKGSANKSINPSKLLSKKAFLDLPNKDRIELLGCFPLEDIAHVRLHKLHVVQDYVYWKAYWESGKGHMPYCLKDEQSFNTACEKFKIVGITYDDFIQSLRW